MNTAQRQTQINEVLANQKITKNVQIRQLLSLELSFLEVSELTNSSISLVKKIFVKYWPEKADSIKFSIKDFDSKFIFRIEGFGLNKDQIYESLINAGLSVNKPSSLQQQQPFWNILDNKSIIEYKSFEVKSPIIKGIEGLNQIKIVLDCLKKLRMKINDYCGIHIHFLTSFIEPNHIHNAVINYIRYEKVIDKFHKPCRRLDENPYCKSLIQHEDAIIQLGNNTPKLSIIGPNQNHKLNFPNKLHSGSICFSQQISTTNYTEVENWIIFLDNLFQFSKFEQVNSKSANFKSFEKFVNPSLIKYFQKLVNK